MNPTLDRTKTLFLLFLAVLISFLLRVFHYEDYITANQIFYYAGDPYDHMRRVSLIVKDFPSIPRVDYYQGFPEGSTLVFSPLLHIIIASFALLAGAGAPSPRTVELVGVFFPACVGAVTVIPVYIFAREFMGRFSSIISSFFFGIIPHYLQYSFIGQTDNNMAEPLITVLYYILLLRSLKNNRSGILFVLVTAIVGCFSLLIWRGFTLFWVVGLLVIVIQGYFGEEGEGDAGSKVFLKGGLIFTLQGLIILFMSNQELMSFKNILSFQELSYFHAIFSIAAGLGLLMVNFVRPRFSGKFFIADILCLLTPALISLLLFPEFIWEVSKSTAYMGRGDVWRSDIIEYSSIFFPEGSFDFFYSSYKLSGFFWFIPLSIVWIALRFYSNKRIRLEYSIFLVSASVLLFSTISHMRFGHILAINVSLILGFLVERYLSASLTFRKKLLCSILFFILLAPAGISLYRFFIYPDKLLVRQKEILKTMEWMKVNTPSTSYFPEPSKRPEYGVLAAWSLGSWIESVAMRPAVATPFGDEIYGLEESIKFYLAEDEDEIYKVFEKNHVRYLVVGNVISSLSKYADIMGLPPRNYAKLVETKNKGKIWAPGEKYLTLVSTSLLINDGLPLKGIMPQLKRVRRLRQLYESPFLLNSQGLPFAVSKDKVFEYVKGATVKFKAEPESLVGVSLKLKTTRGRLFEYLDEATADMDGIATFVLPYSTEIISNSTHAIGPYLFHSEGLTTKVEVGESMVINGETLIAGHRSNQ